MRVEDIEFIPVSVPYTHQEISSQVERDGVTDVLVKVTTDDGLVGWGESCSGTDTESILATLRAMAPFVLGRSPWASEGIRAELWHRGLCCFRKSTANLAYAGIDMALWDICGKAVGQPLYNLFGGCVRERVNYFYYLARGAPEDLMKQCHEGLAREYHVFYLKVGIDLAAECEMLRVLRGALRPDVKLRLDANGSWSPKDALRILERLESYCIDFVEQPVPPDPPSNMAELRARSRVALCANEGLWTVEDAYRRILDRVAHVYCFSSYWVGSLKMFQHLAWLAAQEGAHVCKHTHGELGIAAAAGQHILLTLPAIVDGNQQTAQMMCDDILKTPLPIALSPNWGPPMGPGLGIEVDEDKVGRYHEQYQRNGQFLPYRAARLCVNTQCDEAVMRSQSWARH